MWFITACTRFKEANVKISSGICRGMVLSSPKGELTRPSSAKVREAVMSMLLPNLEEAIFVDLFAGSGSLGLEALSRGAKACYFIERDRSALVSLNKNIDEYNRRIIKQGLIKPTVDHKVHDVDLCLLKFLEKWKPSIVWADPPYADALIWADKIIAKINSNNLFKKCLFVMELASKDLPKLELLEKKYPSCQRFKTRKYGETTIVFYQFS